MNSFLSSALAAIPSAATSGLALAAYALALMTYLATVYRVTRNRNLLKNLQRLPPKDRLNALEVEMGGVRLASGISPEQWLKSRIHRYYFLSVMITCATILSVFVIAMWYSWGSASISVDLYQKSESDPNSDSGATSSLSAPLAPFSIRSAHAADAEFVDPDTLVKGQKTHSLSKDDDTSDLNLRYQYQKDGIK